MKILFIRYQREFGMEIKDLTGTIVEHVYFLQEVANERFGGFHYGGDYVIRDFVAERKDKRKDPTPGAVISEVFRAPYNTLDHEMQMKILERIKMNWVIEETKLFMKHRDFQVSLLPRS